jgi:hypothetical protein
MDKKMSDDLKDFIGELKTAAKNGDVVVILESHLDRILIVPTSEQTNDNMVFACNKMEQRYAQLGSFGVIQSVLAFQPCSYMATEYLKDIKTYLPVYDYNELIISSQSKFSKDFWSALDSYHRRRKGAKSNY